MNRITKFRFWDLKENGWKKTISYKTIFEIGDMGWVLSNSKNCIVSEFTGLLDTNKREIYEGDIVTRWNIPNVPYKVIWLDCGFFFDDGDMLSENDCKEGYEVIGNIYENKELLKKIKKGGQV